MVAFHDEGMNKKVIRFKKFTRWCEIVKKEKNITSSISEKKEIDSPLWHEDILKARKKRIKSGEAKFLTITDLKSYFSK